MNVFGSKVVFRMEVAEPEPGRNLVEEDEAAGIVTTFKVVPVDAGQQSQVTISTEARTSPGLRGVLEKLGNPIIMRRIDRHELDRLTKVVRPVDA